MNFLVHIWPGSYRRWSKTLSSKFGFNFFFNSKIFYRIAVDPIFPPPPVPNSKKHTIPDAQDNKFELIFNERVDAAELKNLPIDDNMNGIIEEEEMEEEGSDVDDEDDEKE